MPKFLPVALMIAIAAPAIAQTPQAQDIPIDPKKSDVNRIVCQKEDQVGSRLGSKKVCLTVKEWQDRAQANREETERVQRDSTVPSGS